MFWGEEAIIFDEDLSTSRLCIVNQECRISEARTVQEVVVAVER